MRCLILLFSLLSALATIASGGGLAFDANSRAELDPALSLTGQSFTVEAWVSFDDLTAEQPILAQVGDDNLFHLNVRNSRPYLGFWFDDLEGNSLLDRKSVV